MRIHHSLWISVAAIALCIHTGGGSADASTLTLSSSLVPSTLMSGTAANAFTVSLPDLAGSDIVSAFAIFNFVDDGEMQLLSSTTTGPFFNSSTSNLYWNEIERVHASFGGGESASAQSPFYSFANNYSFSWSVPCGGPCVMNISQAFHDTFEGYGGGFSLVVPLGPASLSLLSAGSLPFSLTFDGDAIFISDQLVATLAPRVQDRETPPPAVPEPASMALLGLGVSGYLARRRPGTRGLTTTT